jgi:hypothetical protein
MKKEYNLGSIGDLELVEDVCRIDTEIRELEN